MSKLTITSLLSIFALSVYTTGDLSNASLLQFGITFAIYYFLFKAAKKFVYRKMSKLLRLAFKSI